MKQLPASVDFGREISMFGNRPHSMRPAIREMIEFMQPPQERWVDINNAIARECERSLGVLHGIRWVMVWE